jgi:hypothetical protein
MKRIAVVFITCLSFLQAFSQFSFHGIMPSLVGSTVFGDTLLNSSTILKRKGIRKVTAVETSTKRLSGSSFTTTYVLRNGQIQTRSWCYRPSPDTAYRFCHIDTILYNDKGQLTEYRAMSGGGVVFLKNIVEYIGEAEALDSWITFDPRKGTADTTSSRRFYSGKGQLIRQLDNAKNRSPINVDLFYNEDGLIDSIRHDNPDWGTYVFNRKNKGKKKEITLETQRLTYRWLFNAAGQCVSLNWAYNKFDSRPNRSSQPLLIDVSYSYNNDGTLKKVVEKNGKDKVTTVYSYEK